MPSPKVPVATPEGIPAHALGKTENNVAVRPATGVPTVDDKELQAFRQGLAGVKIADPVKAQNNPWGLNMNVNAYAPAGVSTSTALSYTQGAHSFQLGLLHLSGSQKMNDSGTNPCMSDHCDGSKNTIQSSLMPSLGYHGVFPGFEAHGMLSYNTLMKEYMLTAGVDTPQTYNDGLSYQYGGLVQISSDMQGFHKAGALYLYGSYPIAKNFYASGLFVLGADDNERRWDIRPILEGRLAYDFNPILLSAYGQYSPKGEIGQPHPYRNISMKAGFSVRWKGLEAYIETGRRYAMGSNNGSYTQGGIQLTFSLYDAPVAPRVMNHGRPRLGNYVPDFANQSGRFVFRPRLTDSAMISRRVLLGMAAGLSVPPLDSMAQNFNFFKNEQKVWQAVSRLDSKDIFCTVAADNLRDNDALAPSHQFFTAFMYLFIISPSNKDLLENDPTKRILLNLSNDDWKRIIFAEKVIFQHRSIATLTQKMLKERVRQYLGQAEADKIIVNGIIFDPVLRQWMNRWLLYENYLDPKPAQIHPEDIARKLGVNSAMTSEVLNGGIDFKDLPYVMGWSKLDSLSTENTPPDFTVLGMSFIIKEINTNQ